MKAKATKRAMTAATRVAGEQQQQGRLWWQPLWWTKMRAMAMAMKVAGDNEGEGGMAMARVTWMVGEQW